MSWARWRDEIAKAADGSHHTIESIEESIANGRSFLLSDAEVCYIVELVNYPAARACQVIWAAGDLASLKAKSPAVEAWAKANGCSEMLIEGHAGWARALKDIGYRPWSVTVRKALL